MKFSPKSLPFRQAVCLATLLSFVLVSATLRAEGKALHYLRDGKPEASALLPPPPLPESPEQAADLDEVRAAYHAAGSNDLAAAYAEKEFSVFSFTDAAGSFFVETNLPKAAAFFKKVRQDAAIVTDAGKDYFRRPRPFVTDPSLANGKLEKTFSYPSGHSTESMVLALVLAKAVPERREAILARARAIGWHRVQIARHYPTDIHAGRVLAQAIVKQFKDNDEFNRDFLEAKAEIEAARAAAKN